MLLSNDVITITVYDDDLVGKDFIGRMVLKAGTLTSEPVRIPALPLCVRVLKTSPQPLHNPQKREWHQLMDQRLHHRMRGELELEMRWVHVDGVEAATEKPTMISSFVSVAQQYRDRDVAKKVQHSTLAPSTFSSLCASCIAPTSPATAGGGTRGSEGEGGTAHEGDQRGRAAHWGVPSPGARLRGKDVVHEVVAMTASALQLTIHHLTTHHLCAPTCR